MPDRPPAMTPSLEHLIAVVAELRQEKSATADQRKEIGILIQQAVAEVDRAAQRDREVAARLRQLDANLEAFPRVEIRQLYSELLEQQMRLSTWRSQLEQLRSRQSSIERNEEQLSRILEVVEAALRESQAPHPFSAAAGGPAAPAGEQAAAAGSAPEVALRSVELAQHRLSRQLQDVVTQALSDLILRAEVCVRLVEVDRERAGEEMSRLKLAAAAALKSTRQLVYDLQPPVLEEQGVVAALQRYASSSRWQEKAEILVEILGQERRLPPSLEAGIFRIVQESLANAALHSGANRVEVMLRFEPTQVIATVVDQGRGFEVARALAEARRKEHSGLADLQLRAELLGGSLEISSKPGSGCMVSFAVQD